MSLHQLYNYAVSTAILLLSTVYSTFFLCLQVCFPFLLSESRFCRFSLNFASLVFYFSEKVVVNDCIQLSILNKQHKQLFQLSVIAVFRRKINKNDIHRPRSVRIGRNCALGLSTASASGGTLTRPRAQFLPIRTSQPVNNIYLLIQIARCDAPFGQFKKEKLMQLGLFIYLFIFWGEKQKFRLPKSFWPPTSYVAT